MKDNEEIVIRSLSDRDAVRTRPGMYIGTVSDPSLIFREVIDGSFDESYSTGCDQIVISTNLNNYYFCGDNGRGIPIMMSVDDPTKTQAFLAIAKLHAGAKFDAASEITAGMNGVGESCANFLSDRFILMSRITELNYNRSIPEVKAIWEASGPRIRKELYYILVFQKGLLTFEGAMRKCDAEKFLFKDEFRNNYVELPEGLSTMVLFRPDADIFESTVAELPIANIQNFLLIQEKYYKRKVHVWADGVEYASSGFKPYKYEFIKTIIPRDSSLNRNVTVYVTFETDKDLGNKVESGSVNGLTVNQGIHINWVESFYEKALRADYKIKHRFIFNGLRIHVLLLASEVLYDSQTKTRLRSISKVKPEDLELDLVKEFSKIFRKNDEEWQLHVDRLNMLADSMRNISAVEKAGKIIEEAAGRNMYKNKADMVEGFADATAGPSERWECSIYLTEGLSAGGSLKLARKSPKYDAVLPVFGRVKNVKDSSTDDAMSNKEIYTIFRAIGLGIDINNVTTGSKTPEEAYERIKKFSRYGKIVIATDK